MKQIKININNIPSIIWGEKSEKVYLFVHGKMGYKEEAKDFAEIVGKMGWQVLSIDLPEHGERKDEKDSFYPWQAVPELTSVMEYIKEHWNQVALRANSIGAWFSMLSFANIKFEQCLFVSPILDMEQLIKNMMQWASVSEERLYQEKEIKTEFGETLSWKYLSYAKEHPITTWNSKTAILYGDKDNLTERTVIDNFAQRFHCNLYVMEGGEHWFHTPEQLAVLQQWEGKMS